MKIILGIIKSTFYDFNKNGNEYVIRKESVSTDSETTTSFSDLPRLRKVIEKNIGEDYCTWDLISEDRYEIDTDEMDIGDIVLSYKSKHILTGTMVVNEVYYTSMELPDLGL